MTIPVARWINELGHVHATQRLALDATARLLHLNGVHLLDLGIGHSGLSAGWAQLGARVYQVDHDQAALTRQLRHFTGLRLQAPIQYKLDFSKDRLPDSHWAAITAVHSHQHLMTEEGSDHMLREIARALAPDGTFVLVDRISDTGETYAWTSRGDPMMVRTAADLRAKVAKAGLAVRESVGWTYSFAEQVKQETASWMPAGQEDNGIVLMLVGGRA